MTAAREAGREMCSGGCSGRVWGDPSVRGGTGWSLGSGPHACPLTARAGTSLAADMSHRMPRARTRCTAAWENRACGPVRARVEQCAKCGTSRADAAEHAPCERASASAEREQKDELDESASKKNRVGTRSFRLGELRGLSLPLYKTFFVPNKKICKR